MASYITIAEAKDHLRVDFTNDDAYISSLIELVEELVSMEIGEDLIDMEEGGLLPLGLKHAMLLMIGHFYANREIAIIGVGVNEIPFGFKHLIAPYKNFTIT